MHASRLVVGLTLLLLALLLPVQPAGAATVGDGLPTQFAGKELTRLPTARKLVALTFDAGSGDQGVDSILATLAGENVPATFFLTGTFVKEFPGQAHRIAALGSHIIGNHTLTHPHLPALTEAGVVAEVSEAAGVIRSATGQDPRPLFRFPFGDSDARTLADVNALGYASIRWTVDTLGWEGATDTTTGLPTGQSPSSVVARALGSAQPGEIILMHVGAAPDGTTLDAAALPDIIDGLRRAGYGFTTVWDALYAGANGLSAPVVGAASVTTTGLWLAGGDGGIFAFGQAPFLGSTGSLVLNKPVVGMASVAQSGYWTVASDGGVFAFGQAPFLGSTGSIRLNNPVVAMAPTPSGRGYWLVASDGGVFAFGDARFLGSTGSLRLNQPVVGMQPTPDGRGYWLVASDGGVFAFGDAAFLGSTGSLTLNFPIVGMLATPSGAGYRMVASDGGIFCFGDAGFLGSTSSIHLDAPVVAAAETPSGGGYWLAGAGGKVFNFGDAPAVGSL